VELKPLPPPDDTPPDGAWTLPWSLDELLDPLELEPDVEPVDELEPDELEADDLDDEVLPVLVAAA
jgi:hypothetical protein